MYNKIFFLKEFTVTILKLTLTIFSILSFIVSTSYAMEGLEDDTQNSTHPTLQTLPSEIQQIIFQDIKPGTIALISKGFCDFIDQARTKMFLGLLGFGEYHTPFNRFVLRGKYYKESSEDSVLKEESEDVVINKIKNGEVKFKAFNYLPGGRFQEIAIDKDDKKSVYWVSRPAKSTGGFIDKTTKKGKEEENFLSLIDFDIHKISRNEN